MKSAPKLKILLPRADTHLEPAHVEEELQEGEDGNVHVGHGAALLHELPAHQTRQEERVHGQCHHLVPEKYTINKRQPWNNSLLSKTKL